HHGATMYREGIPSTPIKRVEPFAGLLVDAQTWQDAHAYHRQQQQLHALLLHGAGIVRGLEIEPLDPPGRGVLIRPGPVLSPSGQLILVPTAIRCRLHTTEAKMLYLALIARDIPSDPLAGLDSDNGARRPSRMVESYTIIELTGPLDEDAIELARIQ